MSEVDGKKNNIIENNKTFQVGYKPSKNPPSSVSSYKNLAKFELHDRRNSNLTHNFNYRHRKFSENDTIESSKDLKNRDDDLIIHCIEMVNKLRHIH